MNRLKKYLPTDSYEITNKKYMIIEIIDSKEITDRTEEHTFNLLANQDTLEELLKQGNLLKK